MINDLLECIKLLSVHIILTYLAVCSIREYPSDIVLFYYNYCYVCSFVTGSVLAAVASELK